MFRFQGYRRRRRLVNVVALVAAAGLALVGAAAAPAAEAPAGAPVRILVLGDSLTAGLGLPREAAFPVRLHMALAADGIKATVIDAAVSGDTTAGGLARLDWALADKPDAVIVALGANDMLRGLDPEAAKANLDVLLGRLERENVRVLLAGMKAAPNLGPGYVEAFDRLYPDLAARHGVLLYPFLLEGVAAIPELNQNDAIHPNAQGVAVMVGGILPYVKKLIGAGP